EFLRQVSGLPCLARVGPRSRRRVESQDLHGARQGSGFIVVRLPWRVADVQALVNILHMPLRRTLQLRDLVPGDGYRHAHAGTRPSGPGANRGRAKAVAQVVDEDFPDSVTRTALGREAPGKGFGQMLHDGLREILDGIPVVTALQRNDHMQTLAVTGFGE